MPNLNFSVSAKSENPTKTAVTARGFTMYIDEPKNMGGTDHGPTPVEYILASLAGCLNVVAHMAAKEMGFTLRGLEMDLDGDLDPARFMGKDTDTRAGFQNINVNIKADADADQDTLDRWAEIIESRCPVSDNIANATPVAVKAFK